jgi:hypothetical protein
MKTEYNMEKLVRILESIRPSNGDYQRITEVFNKRHRNRVTVTRTYVRLVILGMATGEGEKAEEIKEIAQKYFRGKLDLERKLIAA